MAECTDDTSRQYSTKMKKIYSWSRLFIVAIIIVAIIGYLNYTEKTKNATKFDFKLALIFNL